MDARSAAVAEEQRHVDRAYARLEDLRSRAEQRRREALAAETTTHADLLNRDVAAYEAASRVRSLTLGDEEPLVFGRLDHVDTETHHVGRVSVLSEDYDPLVIDWRSDVAAAFYRATPAQPQGVRRRRLIHCRGPQVLSVEDQLLDLDAEGAADGDGLVGDAALLAAITRDRSARMHDIVATLQREQDEIVRRPARGVVVVTGGPGTGKTAVALHRVAYLLYQNRERLEQRGVLVVGPSRAFADYIARVLPSLGEDTAVLRPLGGFLPGFESDRHDTRDAGAVKGDRRMAEVLRRYAARLSPRSSWRRAFADLRDGTADLWSLGEGLLTADELDLLAGSWAADVSDDLPITVEDVALADELRLLLREARGAPRPEEREPEPSPGLDEITTFAERGAARDPAELVNHPDYLAFGHVVVDEAQDLSPMQWRMVSRRGREAGWTVVGDLAQSSAPGALRSWSEVGDILDRPGVDVARLSVNYRTSEPIMTFAAGLLRVVAPGQHPPRSARPSDRAPSVETGVWDLRGEAVASARAARGRTTGTVGVIAPRSLASDLAADLAGEEVRVFDPWTVKGLEFDAVVVAAPEQIAVEAGHGALYVALTRATEDLRVVTSEPRLPDGLAQRP